jgi:predicted DNA-binding transcriptional regulator AlpA
MEHTPIKAADVARLLGVSTTHVQRLRDRGEGPPWYKIGGRVVYYSHEVLEWLNRQRVVGGGSDDG